MEIKSPFLKLSTSFSFIFYDVAKMKKTLSRKIDIRLLDCRLGDSPAIEGFKLVGRSPALDSKLPKPVAFDIISPTAAGLRKSAPGRACFGPGESSDPRPRG